MRHILIFLTILQLSTGNMAGNELMKLPVLLRHYQLYRADCTQGGWADFLRLHYANTRHRGADPAHQQLPLQSSTYPGQVVMLMPGEIIPATASLPVARDGASLPAFDETRLPSDFFSRLLRPPRH